MKGAIIGDIIGSAFIKDNRSNTDFQLFKPISSFTDDTVLTIATADSVIHRKDLKQSFKYWITKYPYAGYKEPFKQWALSDSDKPFMGLGDGSARRISSIGLTAQTLEETLEQTELSTRVTHNDPLKIKASKAASTAIFMAKNNANKATIKEYIEHHFGYNLNKTLKELHKEVTSDHMITPVPAAITIFLNADNFEDAIRQAISIGGPSNTIGSITGALSHAYFKHIPKSIIKRALNRLTPEMVRFINDFEKQYMHDPEKNHEIQIAMH
jgi:ADP-ribosylglycohydrolase